jgi:hypothetical protein
MTDLRKLAERLGRAHTIDDYERILREVREALREELLGLTVFRSSDVDETCVPWLDIARVLEWGGQAGETGTERRVAENSLRRTSAPAAPDPHEYEGTHLLDFHCGKCGRRIDDPIHNTRPRCKHGGHYCSMCGDPIHDVPQVTNYEGDGKGSRMNTEE